MAQPGTGTDPHLATLHLAAGTYLDADYCNTILRDVDADQGRAIAPWMGADTAVVLVHARRARTINLVESAALLAVAVAALCLTGPGVIGLALVLLFWHWSWLVYQSLRKGADGQKVGRFLWRIALTGFLGFILLPVVIFLGTVMGELNPLLLLFGASGDVTAIFGGIWLVLLVFEAVVFTAGLTRGLLISRLRGELEPALDDARLMRARQRQGARVTVYSGFDPFAFSGTCVESFRFALELRPPGTEAGRFTHNGDWPAFDVDGLTSHVAGLLAELQNDYGRFARIPGLSVDHHFVVSGRETSWPDHPDPPLDVAAQIMRFPVGAMRHYLKCQVVSWGGEVATTVYVHTALQGRTLYVEFLAYVMPPTRDEFHVFDAPWRAGPFGALVTSAHAVTALPRLLAGVPRTLWRSLTASTGPSTIQDALATTDVGAKTSVRLLGAEPGFVNYFQWRDPHKYISIIERQFFVALTDFLRGKVDLGELESRMTTIINNGVVNTGSGNNVNIGVAGSHNTGNNIGAVGQVKGNVNPP